MVNPSPSNSEWLQRKRTVDAKFKAAGLRAVAVVRGTLDGQVVGMIEAKKLMLGPQRRPIAIGTLLEGIPA
jgi:hypothetical protein